MSDVFTAAFGIPRGASPTARLRQLAEVRVVCSVCFDPGTLVSLAGRGGLDLIFAHERLTADPAGLVAGLRAATGAPVLVVAASAADRHGADGVLVEDRPFAPQLAVQLAWLLGTAVATDRVQWGPLRMDRHTRSAHWQGAELALTAQQFRLLWRLCQARGGLVTVADLSHQLYGEQVGADRLRIVAHVRRVRRLIEVDPARPTFLLTVRGEGFRLAAPHAV